MANKGSATGNLSVRRWVFSGLDGLSVATIQKGIFTVADQAIVSAGNFLTGVIIARVCSREELGLYTLGFSIMLFVMILQSSLIVTPYIVYSPRVSGRELAVYTTNTLLHQLCLSALSVAALVIGGKLLAAGFGPPGLAPVVLALAIVVPAVTSREYVRQLSFARLNIRAAFLLDVCVTSIQLAGLLFLVFRGELSAHRTYYVSGAACGLSALCWFYFQRTQFILSAAGAVSDFSGNWQVGKWYLAGGVTSLAVIQAYPWLLGFFYGNAAVGSLAACLGIVLSVNPVIFGLSNYLGPKIMHAYAEKGVLEVRRILGKATPLFLAFMIFYCLGMLFFGGSILRLIYGAKYSGLGMVVGVLALSQLAEIVTLPLGCSLLVMGRPDTGFKGYLLALLVTLTLGAWLSKSYGISGVAFSLLAANTAAALYRWVVYQKLVGTLRAA